MDTDAIMPFTVEGLSIRVNETDLSPFTNYSVIVSARNRAGVSDNDTMEFQTDQAGKFGTKEQFNEMNRHTNRWTEE